MASDSRTATPKQNTDDEGVQDQGVRRKISERPQYCEQVVSVIVGKDAAKKTFTIEKEILTKHSNFFASAFNSDSNWKESKDKSITMEDETSAIFKIFVQFLYTGKLFVANDEKDGERSDQSNRGAEWVRPGQCWVLGEKVLSSSFKDAVTDAMITKLQASSRHPIALHEVVYKNSAGPCGIRRLLVDVAVREWSHSTMSSSKPDSDLTQFFFDVSVELHRLKQVGGTKTAPYRKKASCTYHEHGAALCYKTMF